MAGYTKLFNSILASTIWDADMPTRIVWITLLAMADKHGVAEGSVPGLALFARVSVEECRRALAILMAPDLDSRSQEHEGRRIEAVDGGWRLINHDKYRSKLSQDDRREYIRTKQREYRSKQKLTNVDNVSPASTVLTQPEADTKADTDTKAETRKDRVSLARTRGMSGGVAAGSLPRDHLRHVWCGRVCVPDFLHAQFVQATGKTDEVLKAFYLSEVESIPADEPVDADAIKFWRPRVSARWPPKQSGKPSGPSDTEILTEWKKLQEKRS